MLHVTMLQVTNVASDNVASDYVIPAFNNLNNGNAYFHIIQEESPIY